MQLQQNETDHAYWTTFGKDSYHLNGEMERWCKEFIGPGGWTYSTPTTWKGMDGKIWIMHSMFGHTTFAFKNHKDFAYFLLRWLHAKEEALDQ